MRQSHSSRRQDIYVQVSAFPAEPDLRTCGVDGTNNLCIDCFSAGDHDGHDIIFGQSFAFTTVCDCGVATAWRQGAANACNEHSYQDAPPPKPIPELIQHSIEDTMAIIVDFIIETLQHSPSPNDFSKLGATYEMMAAGLDPHSRMTGEPIERRGLPPWSAVLWADEKHVLRETTRQIRDSTGFEWKKSTRIARETEVVVSCKVEQTDRRVAKLSSPRTTCPRSFIRLPCYSKST